MSDFLRTEQATSIAIENLEKKIRLKNVSLSFADKGLVFVLNSDKAVRKNTFLFLLSGLIRPGKGKVYFKDQDIHEKSFDLDDYRREHIGFVMGCFPLTEKKVKDNLLMPFEFSSDDLNLEKLSSVSEELGIPISELVTKDVDQLSEFEKQEVILLRALIKNPDFLLVDESDTLSREENESFVKMLKKVSKDRLVIFTSNEVSLSENYADRMILFKDSMVFQDEEKNPDPSPSSDRPSERKKIRTSLIHLLFMDIRHFWKRAFAMILPFLASLACISFFGFNIMRAANDGFSKELEISYQDGMSHIALEEKSRCRNRIYVNGKKVSDTVYDPGYLSKIQVNRLSKMDDVTSFFARFHVKRQEKGMKPCDYSSTRSYYELLRDDDFYQNVIFVRENTTLEDVGLKEDSRFAAPGKSRLPKEEGEVAITDLIADSFLEHGYISDDGTKEEIRNVDQLLGKKILRDSDMELKPSTIVGIFSTQESLSDLKKRKPEKNGLLEVYHPFHYSNSVFLYMDKLSKDDISEEKRVAENEYTRSRFNGVIYRLSKNKSKDLKMIRKLSHSIKEEWHYDDSKGEEDIHDFDYSVSLVTGHTLGREEAKNYLYSEIIRAMYLFSSILFFLCYLSFYILFRTYSSKDRERRNTMRAFGYTKKKFFLLRISELSILSALLFFLSMIVVGIGAALANAKYHFAFYILNPVTIFSLLGLCLVFVLICYLPIFFKEDREDIIHILRN